MFESCALTPADRDLLERAAAYREYPSLQELSEGALQQVTRDEGIDFATALLYQRLSVCPKNSQALEALGQFEKGPLFNTPCCDAILAVAPGAFYVEHPDTGADGSKLLKAAEAFGCEAELVPTQSVGTLDENAQTIIDWLLQNRDKPVILASLSKGGADIKAAFQHSRAGEAFRTVVAWVNVGGITSGSPIVTWTLARKIPTLVARAIFWWRRRNPQFLNDLDRRPGAPLDCDLYVPSHLKIIHVVGFPLRHHLSNNHSRTWHRRISEFGPTDAATVLIDSCKLPGIVLPIWGADHYSVEQVDWEKLTQCVLRYLESEMAKIKLAASHDHVLVGAGDQS